MELDHYIQSGIIESYVLGLATSVEVDELLYMRRIYPELNREIAAVERRMEHTAFAEAVTPPERIRDRILQRIDWQEERFEKVEKERSGYTNIYIQPKDNQFITVHKWWKLFFIMVFILSKICLASAIYFYLKDQRLQERKMVPSVQKTEVHAGVR